MASVGAAAASTAAGSGVQMPRMMYGTAWKKDRTTALVEQAVLAGFKGARVVLVWWWWWCVCVGGGGRTGQQLLQFRR
jgi:hypothetical protein